MPRLKLKYAISTGLMEVQKQSIFSGADVKIDSKQLTCVAKFWDKLTFREETPQVWHLDWNLNIPPIYSSIL